MSPWWQRRSWSGIGGPCSWVSVEAVGIPPRRNGHALSLQTETAPGVDGVRFTLNGRLMFLLGMSYYGGSDRHGNDLAGSTTWSADGFNWPRSWATWGGVGHTASAVDARGGFARRHRETRLAGGGCDCRGIIVDVTSTRGKVSTPSGGRLPDMCSPSAGGRDDGRCPKAASQLGSRSANERDVRYDCYVGVRN